MANYGARLRKERREFEIEKAKTVSEARLAEINRAVKAKKVEAPATLTPAPYLPVSREEGRLGDIMRAAPEELGVTYEETPTAQRPIEVIRGAERTYWSPGTRREYGTLREAMTGFRARPPETAAAGQLSLAVRKHEGEVKAENFRKQAQAILGKYTTMSEAGDQILPPELQQAYDAANVIAIEDPKKAVSSLKKAEAEYEKDQADLARFRAMTEDEREAHERSLIGEVPPPPEVPPPVTPEVPKKPKETYAGALARWTEEEEAGKERLAEYIGIPPAYIKPWSAIKRSVTKPIRRERLGRQVDYTRLFGTQ